MTDSTMPDAPEVETEIEETATAPEAETESTESEDIASQDGGEGEDAENEGEGEEVEFKVGSETLKVPKGAMPDEIRERVQKFVNSAEASFTQKFQDVAERSKSIEAREKAVEKLQSLEGEALQVFSRGLAVREELEQLRAVDLRTLWQSNPDQARQISDAIAAKDAELRSIANTVSQKEQELSAAQKAEVARRIEEGKQLVEKRVKGFKADEVMAYAVKCGIPEKDAHEWPLSPIVAEWAHKAMRFDAMQAAAKPKPAPKAQAAEPVKPMKAKGSAATQKDPDKMSVDEWVRWRNRQVSRG